MKLQDLIDQTVNYIREEERWRATNILCDLKVSHEIHQEFDRRLFKIEWGDEKGPRDG